jgi:transcriptional regulator of acetoin/glycerol metabolism
LSGASTGIGALPFKSEANSDSPLCRAAELVLSRLAEQLAGLQAGVLLADREARILRRWAPETSILPKMDRIASAAGSSGSEELIGTNGIGTIVEDRRPHIIVGAEHYADVLTTFTCVGAPIFHPLNRRFEGVVTLNCDASEASPLLTSLIASTAQQIESRLLDLASRRERALLDAFLMANRSGRAIAVVSDEVLLTGPHVARMLCSLDQANVWQQIRDEVNSAGDRGRIVIVQVHDELASLVCTPIQLDDKLVGALVEVITPSQPPSATVSRSSKRWLAGEEQMPGASATWQAVLRLAADLRNADVPVLLAGEPGTGKLKLAETMFADRPRSVIDCYAAPPEDTNWPLSVSAGLPSGAILVVRHVDALTPQVARALSARLDDLASKRLAPRVVATALPPSEWATEGSQRRLLDQLGVVTIELPALRDRRDDIACLIGHFSKRYAGAAPLRFSPAAMRALSHAPWPGNVRQLENLIRGLAASRHAAEITLEALPQGLGAYSAGRSLTMLEQLELDAILEAINRAQGVIRQQDGTRGSP